MTSTVQLLPAATTGVRFSHGWEPPTSNEKLLSIPGRPDARVMYETVKLRPPVFEIVTCNGGEELPTTTSLKESSIGETSISGAGTETPSPVKETFTVGSSGSLERILSVSVMLGATDWGLKVTSTVQLSLAEIVGDRLAQALEPPSATE